MAKVSKPAHYIRQWRKHRGLTLEKLAERLGMTHQNLGKIERFKVPYSQPLLERLAEELSCEPADLIMRDPSQPEAMWTIWEQLTAIEQRQAIEVVKAIKRTGTDG